MHLKFDSPIFMRLFVVGLALALERLLHYACGLPVRDVAHACGGRQRDGRTLEFHAHPEVWLLIAGIIAVGLYSVRVIGPKVVPRGTPIVTASSGGFRRRRRACSGSVSDWPLHDIAENYLYSAHMVQHMLMMFVAAPLFLLATPRWLADLLLADRSRAARAALCLTAPGARGRDLQRRGHHVALAGVVRLSVAVGTDALFDASAAVLVVAVDVDAGLRARSKSAASSPPAKMIYLFLQSVVPDGARGLSRVRRELRLQGLRPWPASVGHHRSSAINKRPERS